MVLKIIYFYLTLRLDGLDIIGDEFKIYKFGMFE